MSEWNPYDGGHRWEHYDDPWNTPGAEHPGPGTPGPWAHGDTFNAPPGCADPEAHMFQDGVNDAIWRDMNKQVNQAPQTPADFGPSTLLGDVVEGVSALRNELQNSEGAFLPPVAPEQPDPRYGIMQPPARPSRPAPSWAREPYSPPPGAVFWTPADPEPREEVTYQPTPPKTKGLWMAIAGVTAAVAVAGAVNVMSSSQETRSTVEVQSGPDDAGFSCDVNGIHENPAAGTADLTFSTSVAGKNIQVFATNEQGTPVAMQNAVPVKGSPTEFSFPSNGMHNQYLVVKAGTTVCKGEFTLGTTHSGDEQFVSN